MGWLVGGWTNPIWKNKTKWVHLPQVGISRDENEKKINPTPRKTPGVVHVFFHGDGVKFFCFVFRFARTIYRSDVSAADVKLNNLGDDFLQHVALNVDWQMWVN